MKKKLVVFTLAALSTITLSACSFNPFNILESLINPSSTQTYSRDSEGDPDYSVDVIDHSSVDLGKEEYTPKKEKMNYTCKDYTASSIYTIDSVPTTGDVKILVIPVWFSNSNQHITGSIFSKSKDEVREDIATAFLIEIVGEMKNLHHGRVLKDFMKKILLANSILMVL